MVSLSLQSRSPVQQWLFSELGAVVFSSKAGELINVDYRIQPFSRDEVHLTIEQLKEDWGICASLLCSCDNCEKWLFYYPERVDEALARVGEDILVSSLGYPQDISAHSFISELARRWTNSGVIQHEIGFALGYPVKDVLGFMGLSGQERSGCCGWCVFGDLKDSLAISTEYTQAKQLASRLSVSTPPLEIT